MSGIVTKKKQETTLDKIRKYYLQGPDKTNLSPKQESIRVWVYKAWNLLINYHSREQAVQVITSEGEGVSRAQAYRYVSYAMSIFGNPIENHKEAERYIIKEDLMRVQQQLMKDKEWALVLKCIAQRIKVSGFDKDKDPHFDPEKIAAQTYILKTDPVVMAMFEKMAQGGSYDFNNLDTEDISYNEVTDTEGEEAQDEE